jgi:hypothetical protein
MRVVSNNRPKLLISLGSAERGNAPFTMIDACGGVFASPAGGAQTAPNCAVFGTQIWKK